MIIGLDVGGTHTDVVLLGKNGPEREIKVPTDSRDLFNTILTGIEHVTDGIDRSAIRRAVLSTTLTTNAVIQNLTEKVGMIVSGGPGIDPELFRTNTHYYTVSGAIDHRGRQVAPIDANEIEAVAEIMHQEGIRIVGVVGKFSTRNPVQEHFIGNILGERFDKVFLGHLFSGNLNFPRRIATTYLNASVYPLHKEFFGAVERSLAKMGLTVPIRLLKPDGGNMRFDASIDHPAQTILSGPAASVMGSIAFAPKEQASVVLDIGGTTTDMALMIDGVPLLAPLGIEIGGYKTLIRSLRTYSIGVGGDSAVGVEKGRLRIGPERLGMAMAFGGPAPTPTDALVVLGLISEGASQRAAEGIAPIAKTLGISIESAADRIFTAACRQILAGIDDMVTRINSKPVYTVHELWEGSRIDPRTLLILGGPAPYFAERFRELTQYKVNLVPHWKVANAIGAGLARTTCEVILFADTEQQVATAPGEDFRKDIPAGFTRKDAIAAALKLLREKAERRGANMDFLETEVIEDLSFNMVRGFSTSGKNIRIRAQVKPGLIHGYDPLAERLFENLS
jgi:N-methylhydantoinase A/oxoprolinase/acetone carboxylase beta subunit